MALPNAAPPEPPWKAQWIYLFSPYSRWLCAEWWPADPAMPCVLWKRLRQLTKADLAHNDSHEVPEDPDTNRAEEQRAQDAHAYENLYALAARLTASGLIFFFPDTLARAGFVVSAGLRPGFPGDVAQLTDSSNNNKKRDSQVIAAAQYILLAGHVLHAECVRTQMADFKLQEWDGWDKGKGPALWREWAGRLDDMVRAFEAGDDHGIEFCGEGRREAVRDMVVRARDKVVAINAEWPEETWKRVWLRSWNPGAGKGGRGN